MKNFFLRPNLFKNTERSQTLVLIIFIVIIFSATIATIASLTTRELEMEEIQERALKVSYVAESGEERARYVLKGSALRFDGSDDYVIRSNISGLSLGNSPHTIEAWIKLEKLPTNIRAWAVLLGNADLGSHHWLIREDLSTQLGRWNQSDLSCQCYPNIEIGKWNHIVTSFDGSNIRGYLNGSSLTCNQVCNFNLRGLPFTLAKPGIDGEDYFGGIIDEVRIYSRALSINEVQDHYNGKYTNEESGLVLLQHFEEGPTCQSGSCLTDDSGNNNNCTPTNFSNLSEYDIGSSGWTRDNPLRSVFIGGISGSSDDPPSCPDSKLPCNNRNVMGEYYYNVAIVPQGKIGPITQKVCQQTYCIESTVKRK